MARVVVEHLTKKFKGPKGEDIRAVRDLNFTAEDGEFLVLVGPSGCGKSTTLRLIAGLEEPTQGSISIGDRMLNQVEPGDRDVAMVFQNHALYPHLTAFENLAFGLKLRKFTGAEIDRRVREAAELLDLNDCLQRRPDSLSGGQRQRVALGRAIVRQPQVLLLDEPLSNLDAPMRVQMRRELARLHDRLATTMIYVTHDQVEALTMGDRIIVLKEGALQQAAEPMTVYRHPANLFVAGFIGSPAMNFFEGALVAREAALFFQEQKPSGAAGFLVRVADEMGPRLKDYAGRKIILGIRPEHVAVKRGLPDASASSTVEAKVELVESLGAETHLFATTGAHALVARIPAGDQAEAGQKISLIFNMRQAHFFNAETGKRMN